MDSPEERDTEEVARLCPYCSKPFDGRNGVFIHLGQVAGRKNHPEDADERHADDDFQMVVDEQGNFTPLATGVEDLLDQNDRPPAISVQAVYQLIGDLLADGEAQAAHRVRRQLLGTDDVIEEDRDGKLTPGLFEALLTQGRSEQSDEQVTATLENAGIMVACRGESALYTATEARDIAARLERVITSKDWRSDELIDLIKFLRHSADVLEEEQSGRDLHEEFGDWR